MAIGSPALKAGGILLPIILAGPGLLEAQPSRLEEYCCRLSWQDRGYWKPSPQGWRNTVAYYPGGTGAIGSPVLKAGLIMLPVIRAGPGLLETVKKIPLNIRGILKFPAIQYSTYLPCIVFFFAGYLTDFRSLFHLECSLSGQTPPE